MMDGMICLSEFITIIIALEATAAEPTNGEASLWVLVAVKSESSVWVAADCLSVFGSSLLPQSCREPDLCQGLVNQPVIIAVPC